jgi:hypothetical protein
LIHTEIRLKNAGSVLVRSDYAELRLRQVTPLPEELKEVVERGHDPVSEGNTEVEWPMIAGRTWKWSKGHFEIEPGEGDSLHADYIIPVTIKTVEFYCYLSNVKKKRKGLGWALTKLHTFNTDTEASEMTEGKDTSRRRLTEQQRQQRPQAPQQQHQPKQSSKPKK